jgi:hypothetical protein
MCFEDAGRTYIKACPGRKSLTPLVSLWNIRALKIFQFPPTIRSERTMAPDAPAAPAGGDDKASKRKQERQAANEKDQDVDVGALERRVHLAELRVREVEAELRYLELSQKRRAMKSERKSKAKEKRGGKKGKKDAAASD